jgi:intracellular sulfur oxidation DsrE/DsrF family protein
MLLGLAGLVTGILLPFALFAMPGIFGSAQPARANIHFPALATVEYGPQKVIYHVNSRGGWRDRASEAWRLVHVVNNHIRAIEPDEIDLRIVFQGDGIDALTRAKTDPKLAAAFSQLQKQGVKFRVCLNTLQSYNVAPETLFGVTPQDFVQAAVAEIAALQKQGFSYIRF